MCAPALFHSLLIRSSGLSVDWQKLKIKGSHAFMAFSLNAPSVKDSGKGLCFREAVASPHSLLYDRDGCCLDLASFQDIVETSDPEPTVSIGIEQQTMLAGRIGIAVFPRE